MCRKFFLRFRRTPLSKGFLFTGWGYYVTVGTISFWKYPQKKSEKIREVLAEKGMIEVAKMLFAIRSIQKE